VAQVDLQRAIVAAEHGIKPTLEIPAPAFLRFVFVRLRRIFEASIGSHVKGYTDAHVCGCHRHGEFVEMSTMIRHRARMTTAISETVDRYDIDPMLASKILPQPNKHEAQKRWSRYFERGFDAVLRGYDRTLQINLRHKPWMLVVFGATLVGTAWLLMITPKGLFPQEDIGQLSVSTEARQDISFEAMTAFAAAVEKIFLASPHVTSVASIVGGNALNNGRMFVELKPRGERPAIQRVLADLRRDTGRIAGIRTFAVPVQNLRIGGRSSRAEYQFVLQSLNRPQLYEASQRWLMP